MKICQSCGGIIGRDCFNPQECAWITQQMQAEQSNQDFRYEQMIEMEKRITENVTKKIMELLKTPTP